jgi:hypothetical protein
MVTIYAMYIKLKYYGPYRPTLYNKITIFDRKAFISYFHVTNYKCSCIIFESLNITMFRVPNFMFSFLVLIQCDKYFFNENTRMPSGATGRY